MTTGEKLDQILELLENKNLCCVRACKISDDFEIAFQLFQEYAESVRFSLIIKDFGQELELLPCKNAAPQLCILLAWYKSLSACCAVLCPGRY